MQRIAGAMKGGVLGVVETALRVVGKPPTREMIMAWMPDTIAVHHKSAYRLIRYLEALHPPLFSWEDIVFDSNTPFSEAYINGTYIKLGTARAPRSLRERTIPDPGLIREYNMTYAGQLLLSLFNELGHKLYALLDMINDEDLMQLRDEVIYWKGITKRPMTLIAEHGYYPGDLGIEEDIVELLAMGLLSGTYLEDYLADLVCKDGQAITAATGGIVDAKRVMDNIWDAIQRILSSDKIPDPDNI